jgi:hypothetical protein
MRQGWLPPSVQRRFLQLVLGGSAIFTSWGCHQHYHYYTSSACPPGTTAPSNVQYGSICDVPTQVVDGGTTLDTSPSRSTTVSGTKSSSRVVVSEPKDAARLSWKRSDPDATAATTTVEGGLDGATIKR